MIILIIIITNSNVIVNVQTKLISSTFLSKISK